MSDHIQFLLLGLGAGGAYAALAVALVVTHRSSGVINFATGAIALWGAYIYAFAREGELALLIPGLPKSVDIGPDLGFLPAAAIAVFACAGLGLALYLLVFKPLRNAPPVASAVASIGVMIVLTAAAAVQMGSSPQSVSAIFGNQVWDIGSIRLPSDRVYVAATILVLALVLAGMFRYTRFGLHTRASAECEEGAYVSGLSPNRIAAANAMIGAALAGVAGLLIAPLVPLTPTAYSLFIVPALAAAIIGRFASVLGAAGAGLVIGMMQSEATYLPRVYDFLPSTGLVELVPLVVVIVVLVIWAKPLPSRGAVISAELGSAPNPRHPLVSMAIFVGAGIVALSVTSGEWRSAVITSLIFAVIGLSQVVVTGYAGQVSLAQLALAGAAAFLVGPITTSWGIPFPLAPLLAALLAAVLGVVVGLPALRVRGLTIAVITLAMAYALEAVWFRNDAFVDSSGIDIPSPTIFGVDLGIGRGADYPTVTFGLLCLGVLALVALGVAYLRRSRLGVRMLAVRANERSAAASGTDVATVKLLAFGIGAFIAGLGGALLAYQQTNVSFQPFQTIAGVLFFATVYLAGVTSIAGGVSAGLLALGGVVFVGLDQTALGAESYQVLIGLALIVVVLFAPEGILGLTYSRFHRRKHTPTVPADGDSAPKPAASTPAEPPVTGEAVLRLTDVGVRYGGMVALDGVSLEVPRGSIIGLIGPNGAGKTTLLDAISGFTPSTGQILLGATPLSGLRTHRRVRAGLGRTFQAIDLYDDLSVRENIAVGLAHHAASRKHTDDEISSIAATLGLSDVLDLEAAELSHGRRQLVSIGRALAGRPEVLLLDEPAGGLDTAESLWLGERLRDIRAAGTTILLVEHDMGLVLGVCDRIVVLDFGKVLATGTPAEIRTDEAVMTAYLGSVTAAEDAPGRDAEPARAHTLSDPVEEKI